MMTALMTVWTIPFQKLRLLTCLRFLRKATGRRVMPHSIMYERVSIWPRGNAPSMEKL